MSDNKEYTNSFETQSTPLAREHAKRAARRARRRRGTNSKATRYTISILVILLIFSIAFGTGALFINLGSKVIDMIKSPKTSETSADEDPVTSLQNSLYELQEKNKDLEAQVDELKTRLNRYHELYGPLDSSGNPVSESEQENAFASEPETSSAAEEL